MNKNILSTLIAVTLLGASIAVTPALASAQAYYPYGYNTAYTGSCVNLASAVSYGSRGSDVSSLQSFLVAQNYPGGGAWMVTGYFGNATLAALKNFQQQQNLPMTGVADAATRAAIARVSCNYSSTGYNYYNYANTYPYLSYPYNYNYNFAPSYPYGGTLAITSMSQNTGVPGSSVTLFGTGFDPSNNTVYFGSQALPGISSSNGTSLTFTIPTYYTYSNNQSVQVYVTNSHGTSNKLTFTVNAYQNTCGYLPAQAGGYSYQYGYPYGNCYPYPQPPQNQQSPVVTYLNPQSGAVGASVTVFGSGFSTSGNTVHFGTGVITNLGSADGQSVSFVVPANLTGYGSQVVTLSTYQVSVTNALGYTSNAMPFTVTSLGSAAAPTISSVNGPTSLSVGQQATWTITVNNPGGTYLTTSVTWGDEGTYGYTSASQPQTTYAQGQTTLSFTHTYYSTGTRNITFTVANASGQTNLSTVSVSVTGSGSQSGLSLTSISPTYGPVGTQITAYGSGFTFANTVHFGTGAIMNVYSQNGTTLTFTVPAYLSPYCQPYTACPMYAQQVTPGSYQVSIENQNGSSNALNFQVQ